MSHGARAHPRPARSTRWSRCPVRRASPTVPWCARRSPTGESVLRDVPDGDDSAPCSTASRCSASASAPRATSRRRSSSTAVVPPGCARARRPCRPASPARRRASSPRSLRWPRGEYTVDGLPPLRGRPMAPLHDALAALGVGVVPGERWGHLPVTARAARCGAAGWSDLPGDVSSQYLTRADADRPVPRRAG